VLNFRGDVFWVRLPLSASLHQLLSRCSPLDAPRHWCTGASWCPRAPRCRIPLLHNTMHHLAVFFCGVSGQWVRSSQCAGGRDVCQGGSCRRRRASAAKPPMLPPPAHPPTSPAPIARHACLRSSWTSAWQMPTKKCQGISDLSQPCLLLAYWRKARSCWTTAQIRPSPRTKAISKAVRPCTMH
jgi:hypothetical protein